MQETVNLEFFYHSIREKQRLRKLGNVLGLVMISSVILGVILWRMFSRFAVCYLSRLGLYNKSSALEGFLGLDPAVYWGISGLISIFMMLPFFFALSFEKTHLSEILSFRQIDWKRLVAYVLLGLGVCMYASYVSSELASHLAQFGISYKSPDFPFITKPIVLVLYFMMTTIMPALVEEFMFRGVVLGLLRRFGDGFAVLISAILFSMFHGNLMQIPATFIFGLIAGYLVVKTGSILPAICIHFFNNFYASLISVLSQSFSEKVVAILSLIAMLCFFVLAILALIYLLKRDRFLFSFRPFTQCLSWKERLIIFFTSPGVVCILALLVFETLSSIQVFY